MLNYQYQYFMKLRFVINFIETGIDNFVNDSQVCDDKSGDGTRRRHRERKIPTRWKVCS